MVQYAYIPVANIGSIADPSGYAVFNTGMRPISEIGTSSNGEPMYLYEQIVAMEGSPEFTQAQKDEVIAASGQWFETCEAYCTWFDSALIPS